MEFFKEEKGKCICLLCGHYCKLKEGQVGICGVNKNHKGKLETLVYGKPAAMHIDPIEKKPLYHFLPGSKTLSFGTVGCNFRCPFCQNWSISQAKVQESEEFYSAESLVSLAIQNSCASIAFTYNEPTIFYPYARDISVAAHKEGLKTVFVSNGFMSKEIREDMAKHIDAFNIDLKSFNPSYYKKVLKGGLELVLDNLEYFKKRGVWLEVTTLVVPNQNDSKEELSSLASFIKGRLGEQTPWHISAFHPDYKQMDLPPTSLASLKQAQSIANEVGLKHVYLGNTLQESPTRCATCKEILLQREGFVTVQNRTIEGKCPKCNTKLAGVYDEQ